MRRRGFGVENEHRRDHIWTVIWEAGMLIYSDTEPRTFRSFGDPISTWESPRVMAAWKKHAENRAYLEFIASKGTFVEKAEARKELLIAARKLSFWEKHPNWMNKDAEAALSKIKYMWK